MSTDAGGGNVVFVGGGVHSIADGSSDVGLIGTFDDEVNDVDEGKENISLVGTVTKTVGSYLQLCISSSCISFETLFEGELAMRGPAGALVLSFSKWYGSFMVE